jgi:hypothetical protein
MRRAGTRRGSSEIETKLGVLRGQITEAEAELIEREAELVDLRAELHAFQLEYDTRVGRKLEQLAAVKEEIGHRWQRINLYRQWGPKGPPRPDYIPVEEQYRRIWQQPPAPLSPPPPPAPDEATEGQIKRLYRELCHRFHPDLVTDRSEQAWRTEVMCAINAAYAARSLVELQTLARQPDRPPAAEIRTDEQRLAALQERLRQIERRLREVEREIQELTDSPEIALSVEIQMARWEGRDLLAEMAAEAEAALAEKRLELDMLKAEMERLGLGD